MREPHPGVSLFQALVVIGVMAVLAVASFASGYMTASIQDEGERTVAAIYRQSLPRLNF